MTLQKEITIPATTEFSSKRWLSYFYENKKSRSDLKFSRTPSVPGNLRAPLIRSLQKFQIGETGEGKHLRKYAKRLKDPIYEECIDLFIKEEQFHARLLAQIIQALDGTLLSWHWTDIAFIALRRMLGLKTELFIILIAEIIGKCFYKKCADKLEDRILSDTFSLIVLDEISHLEFHCSFMHKQTRSIPLYMRRFIAYCWRFLFTSACTVFVFDHRRTLTELGVTGSEFLTDCSASFDRAAKKALLT